MSRGSLLVGRLLLMAALLTVASGHGCHEETDYLRSPVTAVGMVLEREDGVLEARLHVISTALTPSRPVPAHEVRLALPDGGELGLEALEVGSYALWSGAPYEAEVDYRLDFTLDDETARAGHVYGGAFFLLLHGLGDRPQVWIDGDEVAWTPAHPALVEVESEGEIVWRSFDLEGGAIDYATWDALELRGSARLPELGGGTYAVRVCTVDVHRLSSALGPKPQHEGATVGLSASLGTLSGALAGRCAALELVAE